MDKYSVFGLTVFRIAVALLFLQHGLQKLFGIWGKGAVEIFSLMGAAGIIEFFAGIMITFGLFTRIWSILSFILMLFAYFMVHIPQGLVPVMNGGELALLYAACFLMLSVTGGGKFSLNHLFFKKDVL